MRLSLRPASESDAPRIAAIHMSAFSNNAMLLAQFPTAATRSRLQTAIARKAVEDIRDRKVAVLVVALAGEDDGEDGDRIISFAKWNCPLREEEEDVYVEAPWVWPEGTDLKVLEEWSMRVESAKGRIVGGEPCYRLSFIATDPPYERRGAASVLLQWGLEQCRRENVLAYLESTVDAGPLYERHGFKAVEKVSMALKGMMEDNVPVIYEETSFIFRPSIATSAETLGQTNIGS